MTSSARRGPRETPLRPEAFCKALELTRRFSSSGERVQGEHNRKGPRLSGSSGCSFFENPPSSGVGYSECSNNVFNFVIVELCILATASLQLTSGLLNSASLQLTSRKSKATTSKVTFLKLSVVIHQIPHRNHKRVLAQRVEVVCGLKAFRNPRPYSQSPTLLSSLSVLK